MRVVNGIDMTGTHIDARTCTFTIDARGNEFELAINVTMTCGYSMSASELLSEFTLIEQLAVKVTCEMSHCAHKLLDCAAAQIVGRNVTQATVP